MRVPLKSQQNKALSAAQLGTHRERSLSTAWRAAIDHRYIAALVARTEGGQKAGIVDKAHLLVEGNRRRGLLVAEQEERWDLQLLGTTQHGFKKERACTATTRAR